MKGIKKWLKRILLTIIIVIVVIVIAFNVSPVPGAFLISRMFSGAVEIQDPEYFAKASVDVATLKDIQYESKQGRNELDIYYPQNYNQALPVVFWVHGGGYVGGDKSSIEEFANYLVYETGVAVVSINYEFAPKLTYPGQVKQLDEAYNFLQYQQNDYPMLNLNQVIFGGDSAGAQISAQYVVIQTNPEYAQQMNFDSKINPQNILGYISFCGPLDLIQLKDVTGESFFMKFFMDTVGWSLLGTKDWRNSTVAEQISLVDHLTPDFPSSYITDGNTFSFQEQGIAFENKLKQLNVETASLFYNDSELLIVHEYQFNFAEEQAKENLTRTIDFIKMVLKEQ